MAGRLEATIIVPVDGKLTAMVSQNPSSFFNDNDTAVSVASAKYLGFTEINGTPYLANHASILCPGVGLVPGFCAAIPGAVGDVLAKVRQAEANLKVDNVPTQ